MLPSSPLTAVLSICLASQLASAQCLQPTPGSGLPGVDGPAPGAGAVSAIHSWDPDGAGPLASLLAIGGTFGVAGNVVTDNVALHDPDTGAWSTLSTGVDQRVNAFATLPNGELVVGGVFQTAGGVPAAYIARWNGSTWSPLGTGMDGEVRALATMPNGDLVAGGSFVTAGGVTVHGIARWNGTAWSSLGTGADGPVHALHVAANGSLVAAGLFTTAGGTPASNIAAWDGANWSSLGSGTDGLVKTVLQLANGDLLAGGTFTHAGGAAVHRLARWNGIVWSTVGVAVFTTVNATRLLPNASVLVAGELNGMPRVATWDGSIWSVTSPPISITIGLSEDVRCLEMLVNGNVVVGGVFRTAASTPAHNIARFDGTQWFPLGGGTAGTVGRFASLANGDLVAAGMFGMIGGTRANGIARWDGTSWSPMGSGLLPLPSGQTLVAQAFAVLPNGDLLVTTGAGVQRWNGTAWSQHTPNLSFVQFTSLAVRPDGGLFGAGFVPDPAGGSPFQVVRWTGTNWLPIGVAPTSGFRQLLVMPDGDLIAAGDFTSIDGVAAARIARWNGSSWSALGAGIDGSVRALALLPNGDLVAAGNFATAGGVATNHVARWDGTAWSALGTGLPRPAWTLAAMPDGDVIATHEVVVAATTVTRVSRWDGAAWSEIAAPDSGVNALAVRSRGELFLGGSFKTVDGEPSSYVARLASVCPATAANDGSGCAGSGGSNTLTARSLPWIDATLRTRGTGLPNLSVVLAVTSFTSIPQGVAPLASFFGSTSPAGCDLLVGPDIVHAIVSTNGVADHDLFLPSTPPLVGMPFFQQMIPVEVDPALTIVAVTATNSLRLVAGEF